MVPVNLGRLWSAYIVTTGCALWGVPLNDDGDDCLFFGYRRDRRRLKVKTVPCRPTLKLNNELF